jgi:hypothetical protein
MESSGLIGFRHGDHVCALFDTIEEQLTIAAAFITDGLRNGERCLYAGESVAALDHFARYLQGHGLNAQVEQERGALILLTKEQAHLSGGQFDSERMLQMLNDGVETALNDGYTALRTCGDMSWLLDDPPGSSQVVEYEALVTALFRSVRGIAMCQYDRTRLPASVIEHALGTHPSTFIKNEHCANLHYHANISGDGMRPAPPASPASS